MQEDTTTVSLRICLEGHANALALNKESTQIAVAGRSLLKLFAINSDGFTEVCNMRSGKNQNLSYSSNDVAWSTMDSNILATAATNGVVSVWDLSKFGRQKQLLVYTEHERTAHTVTFHSSEPYLLISGSQDGTIKCFDTRVEKSVNTYFSNSESVRDVKFSPHTPNVFSAVSENGTVQLWDMRKWDKCILQYTAHSGPIYTCDWHPMRNWLATGSRDKQIKVWNMDGRASLEHTIHTIAVVGRIKWRPERTYHIASCALVTDYSVHIWDIRRPYIPFASFNEHTNVTTGIAWKGNDSHILLSSSKDSTIFKHAFKDASRPAIRATSQGVSPGRSGNISFANKIKEYAPITAAQVVKTNAMLNRRGSIAGVLQFHLEHSQLYQFLLKSTHIGYDADNVSIDLREYDCLIGCAKELQLTGKKLADLCEHNANVTKKYGKHNATTLWNFIRLLYGSNDFAAAQSFEHRSSFSTQKSSVNSRRPTQVAADWPITLIDSAHDINGNSAEPSQENANTNEEHSDNSDDDDLQQHPPTSSVIISETQILSEITFDNFELLRTGFIYVGPSDLTRPLSFPETALHHDVQAARPQLDLKAADREKSPPPQMPSILKVSHVPPVPAWEPHQFIADALMLQGDVGDVQTSLTILIAMGDARKLLPIPGNLIEHWFQIYIEQLHHNELWNEACTIINLSWLRSVRELNQQSTSMHTSCGECGRTLVGDVGWYCQKCKSTQSAKCCVCNEVVRGLYAWCQGCSHGGHIEHLQKYFSERTMCPTCGHQCTYS